MKRGPGPGGAAKMAGERVGGVNGNGWGGRGKGAEWGCGMVGGGEGEGVVS